MHNAKAQSRGQIASQQTNTWPVLGKFATPCISVYSHIAHISDEEFQKSANLYQCYMWAVSTPVFERDSTTYTHLPRPNIPPYAG